MHIYGILSPWQCLIYYLRYFNALISWWYEIWKWFNFTVARNDLKVWMWGCCYNMCKFLWAGYLEANFAPAIFWLSFNYKESQWKNLRLTLTLFSNIVKHYSQCHILTRSWLMSDGCAKWMEFVCFWHITAFYSCWHKWHTYVTNTLRHGPIIFLIFLQK